MKDWTSESESGDSEDGEDNELPCVIGGEGEGDCIWRGSRRSVIDWKIQLLLKYYPKHYKNENNIFIIVSLAFSLPAVSIAPIAYA